MNENISAIVTSIVKKLLWKTLKNESEWFKNILDEHKDNIKRDNSRSKILLADEHWDNQIFFYIESWCKSRTIGKIVRVHRNVINAIAQLLSDSSYMWTWYLIRTKPILRISYQLTDRSDLIATPSSSYVTSHERIPR